MSNRSALGIFSPSNPDYGRNAGLLAFAATMLQNAGRQPFGRGAPISTAQALGSGALAGLGAYTQAEQQQHERRKPIVINNRLVDPVTHETIKDFSDPKKRQVRNDWRGVARYVDTGEPVFKGVEGYKEKPPELPKTQKRYRRNEHGQQIQYEVAMGEDGEEYEVEGSEKLLDVPTIVQEQQALNNLQHQLDNATDPLKIKQLNNQIFQLQVKNNPKFKMETVEIKRGSDIAGLLGKELSPEMENDYFAVTWSPPDQNNQKYVVGYKLLAETDDHPEAYLDDNAIELAAEEFITSGKMVTLGRGEAAAINRAKITNKAASLLKERGIDLADVPAMRREIEAVTASWKQLQKQYKMVSAFELTAYLNADVALEASQATMSSGVPLINEIMNKGKKHVLGSPEYSRFNAANETFVNEYAKIMSGSMGNTPVSDSMREHAHDMLNIAMTKGQYAEVIDILKQDMDNRIIGFDDELERIRVDAGILAGSESERKGGEFNPIRIPSFTENLKYEYKKLKDDQWYMWKGKRLQRKSNTTFYDPSRHDKNDPNSTGLFKFKGTK